VYRRRFLSRRSLKPQSPAFQPRFHHVAAWADEVKRSKTYRWSHWLHYQSLPGNPSRGICSLDTSLGCSRGCISTAIMNYTEILVSRQRSSAERAEALKFLIHFVADMHQPLHRKEETPEHG
jgi:hypothetical protein